VVDTLAMARLLYPKESVKLDNLCYKFYIDLEERKCHHGALIDV